MFWLNLKFQRLLLKRSPVKVLRSLGEFCSNEVFEFSKREFNNNLSLLTLPNKRVVERRTCIVIEMDNCMLDHMVVPSKH